MPQVVDMSLYIINYTSYSFYRSGFDDAALIVDGAGTFIDLQTNTGEPNDGLGNRNNI